MLSLGKKLPKTMCFGEKSCGASFLTRFSWLDLSINKQRCTMNFTSNKRESRAEVEIRLPELTFQGMDFQKVATRGILKE